MEILTGELATARLRLCRDVEADCNAIELLWSNGQAKGPSPGILVQTGVGAWIA